MTGYGELVTSAVLYCVTQQGNSVPTLWLTRARALFDEFQLSPILFTASGGQFTYDDSYFIDGGASELTLWGEQLAAGDEQLLIELAGGNIESLGIDTPRPDATDRSDWIADLSISMLDGTCYLGADNHLIPHLSTALKRACEIIEGTSEVRYGIAYQSRLAERPASYAHGYVNRTVEEVREMIRNRAAWGSRPKSPDELWCDEINGRKRHLSGLFRGAYPANVLSEAHVIAADLRSNPIGRLSAINGFLWLWELSPTEIPVAETMLEAKKLLVRQVSNA